MDTKFVVKFDYNIEQLNAIVAEVEKVDINDLVAVKEFHKKLVKVRTTIKKQEKEMVDEANAFRKTVFEKRDEYLAITEPVENRLKEILDEEERKKIIEARKELLPMKKQQLSTLRLPLPTDEFILSLDDTQWVEFYNQQFLQHQALIDKEAKDKEDERLRLEREAKIKKNAEDKAEKEKADLLLKAEEDKRKAVQDEKDRVAREAQAEKERKEKAEREEAEAKRKMEADKKYQDFLAVNSYNPETDRIVSSENKVRIYRLLAEMNY